LLIINNKTFFLIANFSPSIVVEHSNSNFNVERSEMEQSRLIRKYVNRRLYDTVQSRYVNLEDLRKLIEQGTCIQVMDQANEKDITTTVLLQIICETQRSSTALLTSGFLTDLIRSSTGYTDPKIPERLSAALRAALHDTGSMVGTLDA